jgi:hypothetical protein
MQTITTNNTSDGSSHWDSQTYASDSTSTPPWLQKNVWIGDPPNRYIWPDPGVGTSPQPNIIPNPNPNTGGGSVTVTPMPVEVEVEVRECPSCEKLKRVDTEWDEGDYVCRECRHG